MAFKLIINPIIKTTITLVNSSNQDSKPIDTNLAATNEKPMIGPYFIESFTRQKNERKLRKNSRKIDFELISFLH